MNLTRYEQETIILFNEEESTATVFTYNKKLMKKLQSWSEKYPEKYKLERQDKYSKTFILPKRYITVRSPREPSAGATEAQKENLKKGRGGKNCCM